MKQCMLFFDIDGTLITEDGRRFLPESAVAAVRQARAQGHLCFVNTGRVFLNVEPVIRNIGFDGYVCGCGTYVNHNGKVLLHNRLEKELCDRTAELARECRVYALYESADKNGIDPQVAQHPEIVRLCRHFEELGRTINDFVGTPEFSFDKFTGWYEQDCLLDEFKREIAPDFDFIDRGSGFCEIVPRGFTKATGIDFLCKYFDIPLERCYAFGDSTNDLSMLLHVPNSVCMGNGMKEVRDRVAYVTGTVEEDGLYHALQHFELLG